MPVSLRLGGRFAGRLHSVEAELTGELVPEGAVLGSQAGDLGAGGIEPLAERAGACALCGERGGRWFVLAEVADEVADLVLAVEPCPGEAGVDRSFLYRHGDLLAKIHAFQAAPPADGQPSGPGVTHASLQADLAAAHERALRLTSRIRQLEHRLSDALGEQAWRESGLGTPADPGRLAQENSHLQQQVIDLRLQLEERDQDLAAARSANRELMAQLNHATRCG